MKRLMVLLALAVLAGCAKPPTPTTPATPPSPPAPTTPTASAVPKEGEVCLKPEDNSGITMPVYKPQGDSTFMTKPGWVIARPAYQLMGAVVFPKPVDPTTVKLRVEPASDWTYREQPTIGAPDTHVDYNFLPAGSNAAEPLNMQWGKPGWITLTVESAKAKDGSNLLPKPVTLKIFAYSQEMQDQYPYLVTCYGALEVSPGPNGH